MMEENKAVIGALLFIALVIGANFIMYGIARGAAGSNQKSFLESMSNMFNPANQKKDNSMDELRQQMEKLNGEKKDPPQP
jgi:uncharacterized protein HemX